MTDKFEKNTICAYCEKPMEAKYRNKRFCSTKCRVYFNREIVVTKPESFDGARLSAAIQDEFGQMGSVGSNKPFTAPKIKKLKFAPPKEKKIKETPVNAPKELSGMALEIWEDTQRRILNTKK